MVKELLATAREAGIIWGLFKEKKGKYSALFSVPAIGIVLSVGCLVKDYKKYKLQEK
jgi:hypothetical protein